MENQPGTRQHLLRLNESPSKKEGKLLVLGTFCQAGRRLNESPSKKEGKLKIKIYWKQNRLSLNESPSKKEGK